MTSQHFLTVEGISKAFGVAADGVLPIIDDVGFSQSEGESLVVVGPSGCGKTTLIRLIAGLLVPMKGRVLHKGQEYRGPPPWLSVVFQDYNRSLFPWLSVRQNVAFGLTRVLSKSELSSRIQDALEELGLAGFGESYPWQLSGGMQQRAALARAIVARSELLLLDEPFASVDALTRMDLQAMVHAIRLEFGISTLLVTHDIDEAIFMGDRILVLSARPARVVTSLSVDISYPRDPLATRELEEFSRLRHVLYGLVRTARAGR